MKRSFSNLIFALFILAFAAVAACAAQPDYIWLEAENPNTKNFDFDIQSGSQPQILSAGKWLRKMLPVEQFKTESPAWLLEYHFDVKQPGLYEFWARLGYEKLRAPLDWRIDDGKWTRLAPDTPTTNLNEVWNGWNEIAWVKAGSIELTAAAHKLTLRWTEPAPGNNRMVLGLDCLAFVLGEGNFHPEGKLRPGQQYNDQIDKNARKQVFRIAADSAKSSPERVELPLTGAWQAARWDDDNMDSNPYQPVNKIPEPSEYPLRWLGINVPSNAFPARKELNMGHRLFYRTQVQIPENFTGRAVKLHFSGTNWLVGVFVNSKFVAGHTSVLVPWDVDITRFVKFGRVNTITIGVKTGWYAIDLTARKVKKNSLNDTRNIPVGSFRNMMFVDAIYPSSKGEGSGSQVGIVYPAKLVVMGPAYTSDVFIRTSVAEKRLTQDVEVTNPTDKDIALQVVSQAVYERTGKVEKVLGPVDLNVAAGKKATVTLADDWQNPKLWWPEDNANVYVMKTTLTRNGSPIDVRNDTFGFRQLSIDKKHFLLNAVPWHFWNWVDVENAEDPNDWLAKFRANNNRFHRICDDHSRLFGCQEQALEWLDRHGIAGRKSACIDGMFITHHLPNPLVWKNFERHVRQVVRAYRNHPSIMHWSIANEMMLITGRLYYRDQYEQDEKRMAHLFEVAKMLDPTRPSYDDGAGDCGGLGEINCQHYTWPRGENFPAGAYQYPIGPAVSPRPVRNFAELYKWDGKRPLVLGEVAYLTANASNISWFGGPNVYRSREFVIQAEADYLRTCIEGARWQQATAICPWTTRPAANISFEPIAAFVREYNNCFYPGSTLERTVKIFNDTKNTSPITLQWHLFFAGQAVASGAKAFRIEPGSNVRTVIKSNIPNLRRRTEGKLMLTLYAKGSVVFKDSKPITILPHPPPFTALDENNLFLYDPLGYLAKWFFVRNQAYTEVNDITALPAAAGVLLVGPNSLTEDNVHAAAFAIKDFVAADNTAVIFEQQFPLEGEDLPIPGIIATPPQRKGQPGWMEFKKAGGQSGAICFPAIGRHPIFNGLAQRDFFTWAGDTEQIYEKSYAAPATGALPLVLAGGDMSLAPMLQISPGRGHYLLCQMLIGDKLGVEPAADRLFYNIISWAAEQKPSSTKKTVAYLADDNKLGDFLASARLDFSTVEQIQNIFDAEPSLLVIRAEPKALAWLQSHHDRLQQYCQKGRWIMLVGLDQKTIASFNKIVGFDHQIRPFGVEAATLENTTDTLLLGVSPRDVTMYANEMIAPWMGLKKVSDRIFTNVVDGENIASFAKGVNLQLANGLTTHDFWQYIQYISNPDNARINLELAKPEVLTKLNLWVNPSYYYIKDLQIVFDNNTAQAVPWTLQKTDRIQTLDLAGRRASQITILIKGHYPGKSAQNIGGIDEIELFRKLPPDFDGKVVILTKPAGLVKYPIGKGGILLNQLDYTTKDTDENILKKRKIYFNILRNMGASFKEP